MRAIIFLAAAASCATAFAGTAFEQAQGCAAGSCWENRNAQNLPPDLTGSPNADSEYRLAVADQSRASKPSDVPNLIAGKPAGKKPSLLKKLLPAALLGAAGGYAGFAFGAAALGLMGPWGWAAAGALVGIVLGLIVLPKLFHLFHKKG